MKKILYIENEANANAISFYKAALEASKKLNWEFHLAYNCLDYSKEKIAEIETKYGLVFHQIDFVRNPINLGNFRAYRQLCDLIDKQHFDIIHCNTPIGGVIGRIVAAKKGIFPIIYQAHGFHFYKGSSFLSWILYYPVEKALARLTDNIITINLDDYAFAMRYLHPRSGVHYVPGVGIEVNKWRKNHSIRQSLNLKEDDFIVLSVGRLEKNKNCEAILDAISQIHNTKIKLVFCGDGEDRKALEKKAIEKGMDERVVFLGNRTDMPDIYHMADCYVLASFREGLSRSIMEAMACGLPCVVSNIRGNRDLIDSNGGILFAPKDIYGLKESILKLYESKPDRIEMGNYNMEKVKLFGFEKVVNDLYMIYNKLHK